MVSEVVTFIETKSRMWLPRAGGGGRFGKCSVGTEFQLHKMKVLDLCCTIYVEFTLPYCELKVVKKVGFMSCTSV